MKLFKRGKWVVENEFCVEEIDGELVLIAPVKCSLCGYETTEMTTRCPGCGAIMEAENGKTN